MDTLKIVSDSSVDMPKDWEQEYDINILPINIQMGMQTFRQGIDITAEKFYQMISEKRIIPHTSLPSPMQIVEFYRKIAKKGESILSSSRWQQIKWHLQCCEDCSAGIGR